MWRHKLNDWEKIDLNVYKFCFEQSEKRLSQILDESEKITTRTYALIGILIPILSIAAGIIIKSISNKASFSTIEIICSACVIILLFCLYFLYQLIKSRKTWYSGTEPQDIVLTHYIERNDLSDDETLKYLILSETESNQYKINENKIVNDQRITTFSVCLTAIIIATIGTLACIVSISFL